MWDLKCIAAAICFLASNILFIIHGVLLTEENKSNTNTANANDGTIDNNYYDSNNSYNDNQDKAHSMIKSTSFNFEVWKDLDPTYIESRWVAREESRAIMMTAAVSIVHLSLHFFMHVLCS